MAVTVGKTPAGLLGQAAGMSSFLLASTAGGAAMGLWFAYLVEQARSRLLLALGTAVLTAVLLAGQDWAGTALGCLLGARVAAALRPAG